MKKRLLIALMAAAMAMAAFSFSAFADDDDDYSEEITEVFLNCYIPDDASMSEGATYPEFEITADEGYYDMMWENPSSDVATASSAKSAKVFTITLTANDGYKFTTSTAVNFTGVESVQSKKVREDGDNLIIKVKAYVCWQLMAPEVTNLECFDNPTASKIKFEKNGCTTVEYYMIYTNSSGKELVKHSTTTSSSLSISSYTKDYDDDEEEDGYEDKVVTGIWVRAKDLKDCSNPYIAPSEWVQYGDGDPDADLDEYDTWGDFINGETSSGSSKSTGTIGPTDDTTTYQSTATGFETENSSSSSSSSSSASSGSWSGEGTVWHYVASSGTNVTGWLQTGGLWYYLDPMEGGLMVSGWKNINNYWYFFDKTQGDTYGSMLTGWQSIDGNTYFFRQVAGANGDPQGSMLCSTTVSISGTNYVFDESGVLVSQY